MKRGSRCPTVLRAETAIERYSGIPADVRRGCEWFFYGWRRLAMRKRPSQHVETEYYHSCRVALRRHL